MILHSCWVASLAEEAALLPPLLPLLLGVTLLPLLLLLSLLGV
jgi:hypothetical protein